MNEKAIRDRLVQQGRKLLDAPKKPFAFAGDSEADNLLNDLSHYPHAFVLGNLMNVQMRAERVWLIPYRISEKLHGFSIRKLCAVSRAKMRRVMSGPPPLHRFHRKMSGYLCSAVQRIKTQYAEDASRIWKGERSSAVVVGRFREFDGAGPKIANLATNDLVRRFGLRFGDNSAIDISADVHVRRVFRRLGLCTPKATTKQVVDKARMLYPEYPGVMDLPVWTIGTSTCRARHPVCKDCCMKDLCPTASTKKHT